MAGTHEGGVKSSQGGRGDPHKASPAAVEKYLKGINFPSEKEQLINCARTNGAPEDVLYVLERFDSRKTYKSVIDISKEMHNL